MFTESIAWKGIVYAILMIVAKGMVSLVVYCDFVVKTCRNKILRSRENRQEKSRATTQQQQSSTEQIRIDAPHSAALLIAFAMIARGEIGFLIASLSQSSGTLSLMYANGGNAASSGEEVFLVIVWAVVLCTIVGPVAVGFLVRRMKKSIASEGP